jgi:hypothetical protein
MDVWLPLSPASTGQNVRTPVGQTSSIASARRSDEVTTWTARSFKDVTQIQSHAQSSATTSQNESPLQFSGERNFNRATEALPSLQEMLLDVQSLDAHSKPLALILCFLGEAYIPKTRLLRAAQPKWFFNQAGQRDSALRQTSTLCSQTSNGFQVRFSLSSPLTPSFRLRPHPKLTPAGRSR